mmetsp:Transcript_27607/g.60413  ORF Transcript_27607/g.60413 Transcript_27607/m.60413 type:complete len:235 (-) Transcript_27607:53-757(-)
MGYIVRPPVARMHQPCLAAPLPRPVRCEGMEAHHTVHPTRDDPLRGAAHARDGRTIRVGWPGAPLRRHAPAGALVRPAKQGQWVPRCCVVHLLRQCHQPTRLHVHNRQTAVLGTRHQQLAQPSCVPCPILLLLLLGGAGCRPWQLHLHGCGVGACCLPGGHGQHRGLVGSGQAPKGAPAAHHAQVQRAELTSLISQQQQGPCRQVHQAHRSGLSPPAPQLRNQHGGGGGQAVPP